MPEKWNVAHLLKDGGMPVDMSDYGMVEIEEMHRDVKQADRDCFEACGDGGVSEPTPEQVADRYVRMVERVPIIEDQHRRMAELLRSIYLISECTDPDNDPSYNVEARCVSCRVRALLREVDGE